MKNGVVQQQLDRRLDEAHSRGLCLSPATEAERLALSRRYTAGEIARPFPGVYARSAYLDAMNPLARTLSLARTVSRLHPDWVFCSFTAALAYGLYVPYEKLDRLHVCTTRRAHSRSSSHLERHRVNGPIAVRLVNGIRVTSLAQTVFECTRRSPLGVGLGVVDAALRFYARDRQGLGDAVRREGRGRHGATQALRAVSLGDPRAENGGESYLRGKIIELGYEAPTDLQVELVDPVDTRRTMRVDMVWRLASGRTVIGELDGFVKYEDSERARTKGAIKVLVDERQRESHITALGYPVARFLYARLDEPGYVAAVLDAFGIPHAS